MAIAANIANALIVGDDDQKIRSTLASGLGSGSGGERDSFEEIAAIHKLLLPVYERTFTRQQSAQFGVTQERGFVV